MVHTKKTFKIPRQYIKTKTNAIKFTTKSKPTQMQLNSQRRNHLINTNKSQIRKYTTITTLI